MGLLCLVTQVRRPHWRKGLRAIVTDAFEGGYTGGASPHTAASLDAPLHVALVAGAIADLHEALRTDKAHGSFTRGGPWETRLCELADGAPNVLQPTPYLM